MTYLGLLKTSFLIDIIQRGQKTSIRKIASNGAKHLTAEIVFKLFMIMLLIGVMIYMCVSLGKRSKNR